VLPTPSCVKSIWILSVAAAGLVGRGAITRATCHDGFFWWGFSNTVLLDVSKFGDSDLGGDAMRWMQNSWREKINDVWVGVLLRYSAGVCLLSFTIGFVFFKGWEKGTESMVIVFKQEKVKLQSLICVEDWIIIQIAFDELEKCHWKIVLWDSVETNAKLSSSVCAISYSSVRKISLVKRKGRGVHKQACPSLLENIPLWGW